MKSSVALLCLTALLANAAPINHQARRESVTATSPVIERRASTVREITPKPFKPRQDSSSSNTGDSTTLQATADINIDGLDDLAESLFGGFSFGNNGPVQISSGSPDDSQDPSDDNTDVNTDANADDNTEDPTTQTTDDTTATTDDSTDGN